LISVNIISNSYKAFFIHNREYIPVFSQRVSLAERNRSEDAREQARKCSSFPINYCIEEVDDSRIDEIYQKIDSYCKPQEGIREVPVVFIWEPDEEDLPLPGYDLPDYDLQIFEEVKNNSGSIATRRTMLIINQRIG
jgi:hypothetical protein